MAILIRPWQEGDIPVVRRILWSSWMSTYRAFIPEKDLKAYFKATYHPEALKGLSEAPFVHGLIAEVDGEAVGFGRIQYHRNEQRLYLASLYLLPDFQGRGVGVALLKAAEARARAYGLDQLWVGVMVRNVNAGRWYERQGFRFLREEPFRMAGAVVSHRIGVKEIDSVLQADDWQGRIWAVYPGEGRPVSLSDLAASLWMQQREAWFALREGCAALKKARFREIRAGDWRVRVQFNPQRIVSTGAALDPEAIRQRPCFLCREHLPPEQQAILYRESYLLLSNPRPIFPRHLTIAHLSHRPQSLTGHMETFLSLAADLGSRWVVFYNGPRAGASAPDHLHFQAAPAGLMPVETEVALPGHLIRFSRQGGVTLWQARGLGRGIIVLEGQDAPGLGAAVEGLLEAMRNPDAFEEEPRVNLLATCRQGHWRLLLFPRRTLRPAAYFKQGDEQLLVSPGAVDMAGILITPRERDFLTLDRPKVEALFAEVAYDDALTEGILLAWAGSHP